MGSVGRLLIIIVPACLVVPAPAIRQFGGCLVLEVQLPVTLEVIRNLVLIKGRSWIKWIDVLIVRESILHRVGKDVPVDLFKLIIREDPAGPKRMLEATTMFAEFLHATEYVSRFLATTVLPTDVHIFELLVHILTSLVPWISVVP